MKVLVVGASGATGKLVVSQLLSRGVEVTAIVRSLDSLPDNANLLKIKASVHDLTDAEMASHLKGCSAVVSCLGHNLTFKGMFGKPRWLVTDTVQCICRAISANNIGSTVKVILMNTTGNSNRDIPEVPPLSQRIVVSILRVLLSPHADNEKAADFLRTKIGQNNNAIEWLAVRPDALTDEEEVTQYDVHASPIRNAIFDSGATSRINVANFMAELILTESMWAKWKGKMPVIYNRENQVG
jgi:NAD(P)-dependent dehydrogenase (short-subunit alcohol dehydrogenase family)